MERVVSASEARAHFGELMRQVAESGEAVIVERDGKRKMALVPLEQYERLVHEQRSRAWESTLDEIIRFASRMQVRRGGRPLIPPPEEVIRQMREERDAELGYLR